MSKPDPEQSPLFDMQPITRQELAVRGRAPVKFDAEVLERLTIGRQATILARVEVKGHGHTGMRDGIHEVITLQVVALMLDPTISDADLERLLEAPEPPDDDEDD